MTSDPATPTDASRRRLAHPGARYRHVASSSSRCSPTPSGFGTDRAHPARHVGARRARPPSSSTPACRCAAAPRSSSARTSAGCRAQEPANALRDAGVDPRDVEFVVLTHLHWDHAGNCDLFPDARVLVQRDELRYAIAPGRFFRKSFLAPPVRLGHAALPAAQPRHGRRRDRARAGPAAGAARRATRRAPRRVIADTAHGLVLHRGRRHQHLRQHRAGHPAGLPRERGRRRWTRWTGCATSRTTSCPRTTTRCSRAALITPIGAAHAARPRYVPPPVEAWDPAPDGAPRLMRAVRLPDAGRHGAELADVPGPGAGPGTGAHRGHRGRAVRHRPPHPPRRLLQSAAGDPRPRGRGRGRCRGRRGGPGLAGRARGARDGVRHLRRVPLVPDRPADAVRRAAVHRLGGGRRLRGRRWSCRRACSTACRSGWTTTRPRSWSRSPAVCNALLGPRGRRHGGPVLCPGAGPVGILAAQVARAAGAARHARAAPTRTRSGWRSPRRWASTRCVEDAARAPRRSRHGAPRARWTWSSSAPGSRRRCATACAWCARAAATSRWACCRGT